jgi:hypothetical protein
VGLELLEVVSPGGLNPRPLSVESHVVTLINLSEALTVASLITRLSLQSNNYSSLYRSYSYSSFTTTAASATT